MSKDKVKVVIFEDSEYWSDQADKALREIGVLVRATVTSYREAIDEIIPKLEQWGVSYVLLDGNLTEGEDDGSEGVDMATAIMRRAPSVKTIGYSGVGQEYVHHQMGKYGMTPDKLRRIIFGK